MYKHWIHKSYGPFTISNLVQGYLFFSLWIGSMHIQIGVAEAWYIKANKATGLKLFYIGRGPGISLFAFWGAINISIRFM